MSEALEQAIGQAIAGAAVDFEQQTVTLPLGQWVRIIDLAGLARRTEQEGE